MYVCFDRLVMVVYIGPVFLPPRIQGLTRIRENGTFWTSQSVNMEEAACCTIGWAELIVAVIPSIANTYMTI